MDYVLDDNGGASVRLRAEAAEQGIDPGRLVFAPRTTPAEHLARHGLADLFLDTLPYNAHTTASDALWMGLPLVTCTGTAFPGRVATSLLHAVGLPELATNDLEHYEALARNLAGDPVLLQSVWQTLANNRLSTPLFDTDGFRRDLEAAYTQMWERAERGEATRGFAVGA
jgi:protein O-GlcNAc transferase